MKNFKNVVFASIFASVFSIPLVSAAEESAAAIEEVVVTGLRRSETVLETPASITALGMEELSDKGITDIRDIQVCARLKKRCRRWLCAFFNCLCVVFHRIEHD